MEAEDKWDSARGPVHSTPKGEPAGLSELGGGASQDAAAWEGSGGGGAGCWPGEGPVLNICRAEAGKSEGGGRFSLGTPAARTAQAGPYCAAGAGVRLQSVGVPRGDCSLGPHCQDLRSLSAWRARPWQACSSGRTGPLRMQTPHGGTPGNFLGGVCSSKPSRDPPRLVTVPPVPQRTLQPTTSPPAGPTRAWLGATVRSLVTSRA